ncbi:MAG: MBL fold metallo-hydrolase [Rhizobiaceae bacterium]|nr:MBL fold metallo-hydrolase [Rhizobiaceae bacterium]
MPDRLRFTILGCGSSAGTPRINGDWGQCDPTNPRNRRTRAAALVERIRPDGRATRVVIDTGPDFREQMIGSGVTTIDAAIYTHAHADHIHGIDDLRSYVLINRRLMDVYADEPTFKRLDEAFGYCFASPPGSSYPPILRAHRIEHDRVVEIAGEGGTLAFEPLPQQHGDIVSLGFRIGPVAYCPDVNDFPVATVERMGGLGLLVIDALQYKGHPSHLSLAEALDWIERIGPQRALLTHMHTPLDYETVLRETPPHVEPAYDGQVLEFVV